MSTSAFLFFFSVIACLIGVPATSALFFGYNKPRIPVIVMVIFLNIIVISQCLCYLVVCFTYPLRYSEEYTEYEITNEGLMQVHSKREMISPDIRDTRYIFLVKDVGNNLHYTVFEISPFEDRVEIKLSTDSKNFVRIHDSIGFADPWYDTYYISPSNCRYEVFLTKV